MSRVFLVLGFFALLAAGALLLGGAAFLIGKYNLLITLRQKLTGDLREIEFILRAEIDEVRNVLQAAGRQIGDQPMCWLAEAEQLAHRSAAQKLGKDNLLMLTDAVALFEKCMQSFSCAEIAAAGKVMTTGGAAGSVPMRLAGLFNIALEYNRQLAFVGCRLVAWGADFTALKLPEQAA